MNPGACILDAFGQKGKNSYPCIPDFRVMLLGMGHIAVLKRGEVCPMPVSPMTDSTSSF